MKEDMSFSKYGKQFQESIAQLILEDRPYADQIEEVLDVNFFELKYLRVFVSIIFQYRQKYGVHPTEKIISSILRTDLENQNEATQKQVRDFFARALIKEMRDGKYIKETSLDFCKKQVLKEAILKSVPLLKKSSFEDVQKLINDAMKLGCDNDFGYHYIKDFEADCSNDPLPDLPEN